MSLKSVASAAVLLPIAGSVFAAVNIDVGRQMFLDDTLVETTSAKRVWMKPVKYSGNPVLKSETPFEKGDGVRNREAGPFSGGVWYDSTDRLFKCWYSIDWRRGNAYATSRDGIVWERPDLDGKGGNLAWNFEGLPLCDSSSVALDPFASGGEPRWKAFQFVSGGKWKGGYVMTSRNGVEWSEPVKTAACGDRSTIFFNPFTRKWVYSLRGMARTFRKTYGRSREYSESEDFIEGAKTFPGVREWLRNAAIGRNEGKGYGGEQLYNFDAVAYEGVLIGLAEIMTGPENSYWGGLGLPKMTDLRFGFNTRPADPDAWQFPLMAKGNSPDNHQTSMFIRQTRCYGDWDMGYLKSAGGVCVIVGDELRFYYTGFAGDRSRIEDSESTAFNGMYANSSMGFASLRRDGFCGMVATNEAELITRPLEFSGAHLFVNADCRAGELTAEIVDDAGKAYSGFAAADCKALRKVDTTKAELVFKGGSLTGLAAKAPRIRFRFRAATIYSFWISPSKRGESRGYLAAGGPGYEGLVDR